MTQWNRDLIEVTHFTTPPYRCPYLPPGPKRDFVGYGRRLPKVFWPHDAKVAVSLVVNYEEGSEYSKPAGDERNEGLAELS